jgi:hypothetical protein
MFSNTPFKFKRIYLNNYTLYQCCILYVRIY